MKKLLAVFMVGTAFLVSSVAAHAGDDAKKDAKKEKKSEKKEEKKEEAK